MFLQRNKCLKYFIQSRSSLRQQSTLDTTVQSQPQQQHQHPINNHIENYNAHHTPVMVKEVLDSLQPESNKIYIDMTFGAGGHTKKIINSAPNIKVIAIDRDPDAYNYAVELSKLYPSNQIIPILGRFSELPELLPKHNISYESIDGILFDFGCSSMQFDRPERGFAVSRNGPLDMRMDKNRFPNQPTAADVLAKIDEYNLAKILKIYGEEKQAKKIARTIIDTRYSYKKIETTYDLAEVVRSCFADEYVRFDKLHRLAHVATKTFQALRIFVNNELNEINFGMILVNKLLKKNGKLITITFHSLEDTIVKRHLSGNLIGNLANPLPLKYSSSGLVEDFAFVNTIMKSNWQPMYKHVLIPQPEEIECNPRSRSAKLRAAIKLF